MINKRVLSLLLALILLFALSGVASMAASDEANAAADTLHSLGLFNGTGTNADGTPIYDLDRAPTRNEAVTMLVRLLGKENEAKAGTWDTPFTDVADWAKPYVGYAYANGLSNGTGATTFGGGSLITASQYLTFVLRALGYSSSTDFKWNAAWELSDEIGITHGEYSAANNNDFLRGNVAEISVSALPVAQKDSAETLAEKLISESVFTAELYDSVLPDDDENPDNDEKKDHDEVPNNDEPQTDNKDESFTLTAFGDKNLHEYLMSLSPSEVVLGPSDQYSNFDRYWYEDQFIADTITDRLKEMYVFIEEHPNNPDGTGLAYSFDFQGTRIETSISRERNITVSTFDGNGRWYQMYYVIEKY